MILNVSQITLVLAFFIISVTFSWKFNPIQRNILSCYRPTYNNYVHYKRSYTILCCSNETVNLELSGNKLDILSTADIENETYLDNFSETIMDESIQSAVRNMINEEPKAPRPSPSETFDKIYANIKTKKYTEISNNTQSDTGKDLFPLDPKTMLEELFPVDKVKDPFDEVFFFI